MYDEQCEDGYDEQAAAEEVAYQEMCEAGADEEKMMMEAEGEAEAVKAELEQLIEKQRKDAELKAMNQALDHGVINKDPDSKYTPEELKHTNMFKQGIYAKDKVGHTRFTNGE